MQKQNGYTLIELLLYIAVLGMLILGMSVFLQLMQDASRKAQIIMEVEQQGQQVLTQVSQAVRSSDAINSPGPGVTASSLSLSLATPANDPTVFSVNSGVLEVTEGVASPVALTNGRVTVTSIDFVNVSYPSTAGAVQVVLTLEAVNQSGRAFFDVSKIFTTTIALY